MIAFLDHDDFKSSRKAALITASTILVLANAEILGHTISIGGLNVAFSFDRLMILLKIVLIYFALVFLLRFSVTSLEYWRDLLSGKFNLMLKARLDELPHFHNALAGPDEEKMRKDHERLIRTEMSKRLRPYEWLIASANLLNFAIVEVGATLALTYFALFRPEDVGNFLDSFIH